MEFHVRLPGPKPDIGAIEHAFQAFDPAAVVDIDAAGRLLRIAAAVDAAELVSLLCDAGFPVMPDQVIRVPSICCGGCSG